MTGCSGRRRPMHYSGQANPSRQLTPGDRQRFCWTQVARRSCVFRRHYAKSICFPSSLQAASGGHDLRVGVGDWLFPHLGCLLGQTAHPSRSGSAIGSGWFGGNVDAFPGLARSGYVAPGNVCRLLYRSFLWRVGDLFSSLQLLARTGMVNKSRQPAPGDGSAVCQTPLARRGCARR